MSPMSRRDVTDDCMVICGARGVLIMGSSMGEGENEGGYVVGGGVVEIHSCVGRGVQAKISSMEGTRGNWEIT
ncbi:hypothetical protein KI387_016682, partial [Taxus chinensis]